MKIHIGLSYNKTKDRTYPLHEPIKLRRNSKKRKEDIGGISTNHNKKQHLQALVFLL